LKMRKIVEVGGQLPHISIHLEWSLNVYKNKSTQRNSFLSIVREP